MEEIEADGSRGDFMAVVTRRELDDEITQVGPIIENL